MIEQVLLYEKIETHIIIDGKEILFKNKDEQYIFEDKVLKITHKNQIFKIISKKIGSISDKELKDYYNEVIEGDTEEEEYYKNENIKEEQNFSLEISQSNEDDDFASKNSRKNDRFIDEDNQDTIYNYEKTEKQKTGAEQVRSYERDISVSMQKEISPNPIFDREKFVKEIKNSKNVSKRTKNMLINKQVNKSIRYGEKETKEFFMRKDQYLGRCQICGFTFSTKDGVNYFERFTWSDYRKIKSKSNLVYFGNSLCLCAKCHSILKEGDFQATFLTDEIMEKLKKEDYDFDTFLDDINSNGPSSPPDCFKEHIEFNDIYSIDIRLNYENRKIYFTEVHLCYFFHFLKNQ